MPDSTTQTSPVPADSAIAEPSPITSRITLATLRRWAAEKAPFAMLTCYDATTARWLARAGVPAVLVGDTAAQMILGYDSTLPAPMDFMVEITAAVRRGAPNLLVMADMPFGSYHCGDDQAMANAVRFVKDGGADVVKLEVDASFAPLIERMAHAGVPVAAHVGSRPQQIRAKGGYRSAGRTREEARKVIADARAALDAGAAVLLIEAAPAEVSAKIIAEAEAAQPIVPVIGCGAGPDCHGHVIVLHDLLRLSDWQPPFAPPQADVGAQITAAAAKWSRMIAQRQYLRDDHPYKMTEPLD